MFGGTGAYETLALTQTELDVMQALGWNLSLKQDVDSTSGAWETPTDWSTGSMPIEAQDALITGADVTLDATVVGVPLDSTVIVNSIATSADSILSIGESAPTTLIAVDGTNLNTEDTFSVASGNLGDILVYADSALQVGYVNETFDNAGLLAIGQGSGPTADLYIAGSVTLDGDGTVVLAQFGGAEVDILNAPNGSGSVVNGDLINVDNTIVATSLVTSLIDLGLGFDNQSGGKVDAQGDLQISVTSAFTNEGVMTAEAGGELYLGSGGAPETLANTGEIYVDSRGILEVGDNFTLSGGAIVISSEGYEYIDLGGSATGIDVYGFAVTNPGGVDSATTVEDGGAQYLDGGAAASPLPAGPIASRPASGHASPRAMSRAKQKGKDGRVPVIPPQIPPVPFTCSKLV